jgi:ubiquinone/menaquinone biosynthesis C-methylase UbiE
VRVNTNRWNRIRYTLWAPLYDKVVRFHRQRRRAIGLLELQVGERVLIVGAGTGADLRYIPPGVEVTATDLTPAMVERTRARADTLGMNVDARVMDAQTLSFPDSHFDAVILHLILAVVPEPVAAIREVERVLRPGGRAVVFDKWAAEGRPPSLARRVLNLFANVIATDVTRQLGALVRHTRLHIEHREPAGFSGFFEIALLRKAA